MQMNAMLLLGVFFTAGCGGKIAPGFDETDAGALGDSAKEDVSLTIQQACDAMCADRAECGSSSEGEVKGCVDACLSDAAQPGCGMVAATWRKCFAKNLADAPCNNEPPQCQPAYCNYIRCHSSPSAPVPDFCN